MPFKDPQVTPKRSQGGGATAAFCTLPPPNPVKKLPLLTHFKDERPEPLRGHVPPPPPALSGDVNQNIPEPSFVTTTLKRLPRGRLLVGQKRLFPGECFVPWGRVKIESRFFPSCGFQFFEQP